MEEYAKTQRSQQTRTAQSRVGGRMRDSIRLECPNCGRTSTLNDEEQKRILAKLTLTSQAEVIECPCGFFQFILRAEIPRRSRHRAA
jgi:hypothetical protein